MTGLKNVLKSAATLTSAVILSACANLRPAEERNIAEIYNIRADHTITACNEYGTQTTVKIEISGAAPEQMPDDFMQPAFEKMDQAFQAAGIQTESMMVSNIIEEHLGEFRNHLQTKGYDNRTIDWTSAIHLEEILHKISMPKDVYSAHQTAISDFDAKVHSYVLQEIINHNLSNMHLNNTLSYEIGSRECKNSSNGEQKSVDWRASSFQSADPGIGGLMR